MAGNGKQAKVLEPEVEQVVLHHLAGTRHPERDRAAFLLSVKAGLRVGEVAALTWAMVTTPEGAVADLISLPNSATKGRKGGRTVPLNPQLREALRDLRSLRSPSPADPVVYGEDGGPRTANALCVWFHDLYRRLGLNGCSSHSGRRTFVTRAARKIVEAGGSLRDVQALAGHAHLGTTQRYIEADSEAQRRVVELL